MSFRKEKKFLLSYSDMTLFKEKIFSYGMRHLYPSRQVNSCYFDNDQLTMFHESEEGVLPRKKVRVRWYNKGVKYIKEIKVSSIEGRYKISDKLISSHSLEEIEALDFFDEIYGVLKSVLIISYQREYYSFENLRITFDTAIKYTDLRASSRNIFEDEECVMEIKVPIDCGEDYIEDLIFYPTSRFSKYSRGLLKADWML